MNPKWSVGISALEFVMGDAWALGSAQWLVGMTHRQPILILRAVILVFNCYHCIVNMTWDQPDSCLDRSNSHIVQLNLGMEAKVSMVRHPRRGQMGESTDNDMETQISTASREESSPFFWRNNILSLLSIHSFI